jgi:hypothetical protein
MGTIITRIFAALIPVFAGIGVGKIVDKTAADKLPNYESNGLAGKKLLWFAVSAVVGTLVVKFIGKKFNIKLLK